MINYLRRKSARDDCDVEATQLPLLTDAQACNHWTLIKRFSAKPHHDHHRHHRITIYYIRTEQ